MTLLLTALILILFKNKFLTLDDIGQRMDTVVIYQHGPLTFIVALHRQLMAIPIEQRIIIISIAVGMIFIMHKSVSINRIYILIKT